MQSKKQIPKKTSGECKICFKTRRRYVETVNFRLYFKVIILSDDDFEIKSKIYSFNLRLVLKHILHSHARCLFSEFAFYFIFLNCWLVMVFGLCKLNFLRKVKERASINERLHLFARDEKGYPFYQLALVATRRKRVPLFYQFCCH